MTPALVLVLLSAVLVGVGIYLLLERSLTRIIIGFSLLSNGVNIMILVAGGRAGAPPLIGRPDPAPIADPLPQAFALTAIVITLGITAFLLAMAYRSWQLNGHDEVQDDLEDRLIADRAVRERIAARRLDDDGTPVEADAPLARDETGGDDAIGAPHEERSESEERAT
ncbi:Na(+)/H(+) antiporter subunit C [Bowdeniella nasicola]|uniref:Na(+)/H(+) antiporter subunit C n=1 Tax=Bowdeniella nasicola TaxID=208480 RepID=A0A1Q5Q1T3_9ACTO|nr:Na(+)/H(+) antiporter subunit C [Bowdeniella nasicola]OKL53550.1 Na(+)/H(+) antiporter subunit C [Bowdeniella nasicola]